MSKIQLDQKLPQVEIRVLRQQNTDGQISDPQASANSTAATRGRWWVAGGMLLLVLACYVLTNPGRIDVIDGQIRFDVAYNWLTVGRPIVRDPWVGSIMGVPGRNGAMYSYYGAPASVFSIPLVWLGLQLQAHGIDSSQFLFSFTSSIIGALIAPVLFLFYLELGITVRKAFLWTLVSSFATLVWPASCTTFDNAQHAFFGIAAAYLGFVSARRRSSALALAGGLAAGVLILYQEYFLLIVPALAVSTLDWSHASKDLPATESEAGTKFFWNKSFSVVMRGIGFVRDLVQGAFRDPGDARSSCLRYLWFLVGVAFGFLISFAYNDLRFGSFFDNGKMRNFAHRHPVWGNPIAGFPTLLVSPGKSLLLYSPPLVLGLLAIGALWRRKPKAAFVILAASVPLVLFMSCYAGLGGDWCWGPRYLTILLPLWALAFPFLPMEKVRRDVVMAVVGLGLLVQVMAISVETQRFFFERAFNDYFWAEDPWAYFKHSALFARVGETISLADGPPATANFFNSSPVPDSLTYTILGPPPPRSNSPVWMSNFKIYYLPRPWPLWLSWFKPVARPVNLGAWFWGVLTVGLMGVGLICHGFGTRRKPAESIESNLSEVGSAVAGS